jgi:hypothetical protein
VSNFIEMDFDEWCDTYKPIPNNIDTNASFDGAMFETYGAEVEFVKKADPAHIWTYGDGDDGGSYIWNGWSFVNRIGYFITEVPCPADTTIQIKVGSYWYYCEGCQTEMEDDGQEINDSYGQYDVCPNCCTVEELQALEAANG